MTDSKVGLQRSERGDQDEASSELRQIELVRARSPRLSGMELSVLHDGDAGRRRGRAAGGLD